MGRLLLRAVVFLASAAVGLVVTSLLIDGFVLSPAGFLLTLVVYAVLQSALSPLIGAVAKRHAPVLLGGVGLLSTFVSLLVATHVTDGLVIKGFTVWVAATVLVWIVTAAATIVLPWLLPRGESKKKARKRS